MENWVDETGARYICLNCPNDRLSPRRNKQYGQGDSGFYEKTIKISCKKIPHKECKDIRVSKRVPERKCQYVKVPKNTQVRVKKCQYVKVPKCRKVPQKKCHKSSNKPRMRYGKPHTNQQNSKLTSGALTNKQSEEKICCSLENFPRWWYCFDV